MIVQIDSREQPSSLQRITAQFDELDIRWFVSKLYAADYCNIENPKLLIERKKDLLELISTLTTGHERFRNELARATSIGAKIIVLCEHGAGIDALESVKNWTNPRLKNSPKATTGGQLAAIMERMTERYGVEWQFCRKQNTGKRIVEILQGGKPNE